MESKAWSEDWARAFRATLTEAQLHKSIAALLDWILLPPATWTTFPAGWGRLPKAVAGFLKGCGLKPGFPDIMIFHGGCTFGVELKRPGKGLSVAQKAMRPKLEAAGIAMATCSSPEEVVRRLRNWGVPLRKALINGDPTQPVAHQVAEPSQSEEPAQGETQTDW